MKKNILLLISAMAMCMGITSCTKDNDSNTKDEDTTPSLETTIKEKIVGKWRAFSSNGVETLTDQIGVVTFRADGTKTTTVYMSNFLDLDWVTAAEGSYSVKDNKVYINEAHWTSVNTVATINDSVLVYSTMKIDKLEQEVNNIVFHRVNHDFSTAIVGVWEGVEMVGDSTFGAANHSWEFASDGTYCYYSKTSDGTWDKDESNTLNEYFVDGDYLAFRWVKDGTEYHEWWIIEQCGDEMTWTATRIDESGVRFTNTLKLSRIK